MTTYPAEHTQPPAQRPPWRRLSAGALIGFGLLLLGFGVAALLRAVPPTERPASTLWWAAAGAAAAGAGGWLWLIRPRPMGPRLASAAIGAGVCVALILTLVVSLPTWRMVVGQPDNQPAKFYAAERVVPLVQSMLDYTTGRPVLGLYLSNHYESSIITPVMPQDPGHLQCEIISVMPSGQVQSVVAAMSEGLANAVLDMSAVDLEVIPQIASDVIALQELSPRDELRLQLQQRDKMVVFGVLSRKGGEDQPWIYYNLDGTRALY